MKRHFLYILLAIFFLVFSGNFILANPHELYEKAVAHMRAARAADSYTEAYALYKSARMNIEKILSESESSEIATDLTSGEANVGGFNLEKFRELEEKLKQMAETEVDPLACAFHLVNQLNNDSGDRFYMAYEIADICADYGQNDGINQIGKNAK